MQIKQAWVDASFIITAIESKDTLDRIKARSILNAPEVYIPAPAYAEYLVKGSVLEINFDTCSIVPFDELCADLYSNLEMDDQQTANKSWRKFDYQILSILRRHGANCFYTTDNTLAKRCEKYEIRAPSLDDIQVSDKDKQHGLDLHQES